MSYIQDLLPVGGGEELCREDAAAAPASSPWLTRVECEERGVGVGFPCPSPGQKYRINLEAESIPQIMKRNITEKAESLTSTR